MPINRTAQSVCSNGNGVIVTFFKLITFPNNRRGINTPLYYRDSQISISIIKDLFFFEKLFRWLFSQRKSDYSVRGCMGRHPSHSSTLILDYSSNRFDSSRYATALIPTFITATTAYKARTKMPVRTADSMTEPQSHVMRPKRRPHPMPNRKSAPNSVALYPYVIFVLCNMASDGEVSLSNIR